MPADLPTYRAFLPDPLLSALDAASAPVPGVPGLRIAAELADFPDWETPESLEVVVEVYRAVRDQLAAVLEQRVSDRAFVDTQTLAMVEPNRGLAFRDPAYQTVIGARDERGRIVVGPIDGPEPEVSVTVPSFLVGDQITLFGPAGSARMCIHAMNALHRRRPDEPALVSALVEASGLVPRWGADDEDSRTPIMASLLRSSVNLRGCFDGTITDPGRQPLALADQGLSIPIKRIPGLALPDGSHLLDGEPLPLHLYALVSHVWHHRRRPEALVFYLPKLETEGEAAYVHALLQATAAAIHARDPEAVPEAVRLLLVFENPRAIFRIRQMAAALGPHFLGGSLGWHDFLASTARLFRHDPRYRIPVKADPNIVIERIQASHRLLVRSLEGTGALTIGGMYGVLFNDGDEASFQISMVGYIRDVTTQLKRGLSGFWVAHPDFVRIGIALVQAWRRREWDFEDTALAELIRALVPDPVEQQPLLDFVLSPDVPGLAEEDPLYPRAVLAADLEQSTVIANHDPEEVRYNVFQALQYLADWLSGNGCVALPATLPNTRGEPVPVRIMDDLATTERSRWELWAEVHHGRVSVELFDTILDEQIALLQGGESTASQQICVPWQGEAARWYPVAARLLRALITSDDPPEFVSEWTLVFTFPLVRSAPDPWQAACALCPGRWEDPAP